MTDAFGLSQTGSPMADWKQSALRQYIQTHFQPTQTQANPSWVNSVSLQAHGDGMLVVGFPHTYFQDWFEQFLQKDFESFVLDNFPGISGFVYQSQNHCQPSQDRIFPPFPGEQSHTFQRFVHNAKNQQHVVTAQALTRQVRWPTTPMLICGPNGCGKSHFLLAIANDLVSTFQSGPVVVLAWKDLQNFSRLAEEDKEKARNELHTAKALLIDDVHRVEGSPSLQSELVHVHDALEEVGTPMVFTCLDQLPDSENFQPKLRSRLEGGLILHLKTPDLDTRILHVRKENEQRGLDLSEGDQLALARQCPDFQSIHQVLLRLGAQKNGPSFQRQDMSTCIAQSQTHKPQPLSCREIVSRVAKHFSMPAEEVLSHRRQQRAVLARQIAIYICRSLHDVSYTQLGALFGGRNHSSIIYAYKKIQSLQKERPEIKSQVQTIMKQCADNSQKTKNEL